MTNDRLRSAMVTARRDVCDVAGVTGVDPKTVYRWLAGRVPHPRHRRAICSLLSESEDFLWASAAVVASPAEMSAEVVAVYAHRADLPAQRWWELLTRARRQIDLLGYAMLFLPEQHPELISCLKQKAGAACRIRIALSDPDCAEVAQRDAHEQLEGTLPGRIRTTFRHLRELWDCPNVEIRCHSLPLYNATYRFDEEMLVTPYLYGIHGFQHPLLHLRCLAGGGLFANYAQQFETIWTTTRSLRHVRTVSAPARRRD
jgi:hypothetical protein